jgi:uncharacterized protein YdeI (YjbR/CyaY-like superfamily)
MQEEDAGERDLRACVEHRHPDLDRSVATVGADDRAARTSSICSCVAVTPSQYARTPSVPVCSSPKGSSRYVASSVKSSAAAPASFSRTQRFTQHRARSQWSKRNVGLVERLSADGRMHAAGLAEVERAKSDRRWDRVYAGQAQTEVPADLRAALDADPAAVASFEALSSQNRYAVVYRIESLRRADSRARRIEQYVAMLAWGETLHPQRPR